MTARSRQRRFQPHLVALEDRIAPAFGPAGPEFHVNTYTTNSQINIQVAMSAAGQSVVVWSSEGQDGHRSGIYGQLYNADGSTHGDEFRVNSTTTWSQWQPAAAMDAAGNFVVVWGDSNASGPTTVTTVRGQRFASDGSPIGSEFQLDTSTNLSQDDPAVAMSASGAFVVAWEGSANPEGLNPRIFAQRFNSAGAAVGAEFQVDGSIGEFVEEPDVDMDSNGNIVVSWSGGSSGHSDIFARRYDADGEPLGSAILVTSPTTQQNRRPKLAVDSDGEFLITWHSRTEPGTTESRIWARRFDSAGQSSGPAFQVNTVSRFIQSDPIGIVDPRGRFLVAWHTSDTQFGSEILVRRFANDGSPLGAEFRINEATGFSNGVVNLASDADGDLLFSWNVVRRESATDLGGIWARRFHANRPPTTSGLPNVAIPVTPPSGINLAAGFVDEDDGLTGLTFTVAGNTNVALFASTTISGSTLTLTPAGANGSADLTIRATDADGDFVETTFTATVTGAAPAVTSTQVNSGSPQRSRVTDLTITFNGIVNFAGPIAGALTLARTSGGAVSFSATAGVINGVTVVTLGNFAGEEAEFGSLRDGRYTLTVLASQISAGGQPMAANHQYQFHRYYGDMNGDARIDIADFGFFSAAYLQPTNYNAALDFNNDGRIDIADFGQFSVRIFTSLP